MRKSLKSESTDQHSSLALVSLCHQGIHMVRNKGLYMVQLKHPKIKGSFRFTAVGSSSKQCSIYSVEVLAKNRRWPTTLGASPCFIRSSYTSRDPTACLQGFRESVDDHRCQSPIGYGQWAHGIDLQSIIKASVTPHSPNIYRATEITAIHLLLLLSQSLIPIVQILNY